MGREKLFLVKHLQSGILDVTAWGMTPEIGKEQVMDFGLEGSYICTYQFLPSFYRGLWYLILPFTYVDSDQYPPTYRCGAQAHGPKTCKK
jgi:hypothetical protein